MKGRSWAVWMLLHAGPHLAGMRSMRSGSSQPTGSLPHMHPLQRMYEAMAWLGGVALPSPAKAQPATAASGSTTTDSPSSTTPSDTWSAAGQPLSDIAQWQLLQPYLGLSAEVLGEGPSEKNRAGGYGMGRGAEEEGRRGIEEDAQYQELLRTLPESLDLDSPRATATTNASPAAASAAVPAAAASGAGEVGRSRGAASATAAAAGVGAVQAWEAAQAQEAAARAAVEAHQARMVMRGAKALNPEQCFAIATLVEEVREGLRMAGALTSSTAKGTKGSKGSKTSGANGSGHASACGRHTSVNGVASYPSVLYGPPGTGKTVTLVEAALQLLSVFKVGGLLAGQSSQKLRLLLVAPQVGEQRVESLDIECSQAGVGQWLLHPRAPDH